MSLVSTMEWKSNTPPEWEWENAAIYGSSAIEMGRDLVGNGSTYSLADVGFSSSSKNSISSYVYPLSKDGTRNVEGIDEGLTLKNGDFQIPGPSSIGLKLGRHSYFEEKGVSFSVMPTSSASSSLPSTKRARASYQSTQMPHCQVEGCNLDLVSAKDYHRRHRICESHSKSPKVIVAGLERRFCQQCSRFHDLSEFDERKRSCRRRLSDHNARRRRPPRSEAIQFVSAPMSSSLYDQRSGMNFVLNRVPVPVSNQIWDSECSSRSYRVGAFDRKLNFPSNVVMPNAISMPPRVLNHGSETSAITTSNFSVPPKELHSAFSLLSTNSRALDDSEEFTSLHHHHHHHHHYRHHHHHQQQQQQLTPEFNSHPLMNLDPPNWALSEYARPHNSDLHNNNVGTSSSTQFQEFQLLKSPQMSGCFNFNHIN